MNSLWGAGKSNKIARGFIFTGIQTKLEGNSDVTQAELSYLVHAL